MCSKWTRVCASCRWRAQRASYRWPWREAVDVSREAVDVSRDAVDEIVVAKEEENGKEGSSVYLLINFNLPHIESSV